MGRTEAVDIAVMGGGVAGFCYAAFQKALAPARRVVVFERGRQTLGRILVSGNGRSNFFNSYLQGNRLPDEPLFAPAQRILGPDWGSRAFAFFNRVFGVPYYVQDWLYYPFANKADVLRNAMVKTGERLGVEVVFGELVRTAAADGRPLFAIRGESGAETVLRPAKTVLALGGSALQYPAFDWERLKALDLSYRPFVPALAPVVTAENTAAIEGQRVRCRLTLRDCGRRIYGEDGEVLFKRDGLSGICVFNASIRIDQTRFGDYGIDLDLTRHDGVGVAVDEDNAERCFPLPVARYLRARARESRQPVGTLAADLPFRLRGIYPFRNAEVSKGGIDPATVDPLTMALLAHPDVCVLGELLDIPLPCGGFNIGMGIVEAYKAAWTESLKNQGAR